MDTKKRINKLSVTCFTVICMFFVLNNSNAQGKYGDLIVNLRMSDSFKKHQISYSIYQGDTLKSITKLPDVNGFEKIHSLTCGRYKVQIYIDNLLYHEFPEITLECGFNMQYHIDIDKKTAYDIVEKSEPDMFSEVNTYPTTYDYFVPYVSGGYGTGITEIRPYPIEHQFKIGSGGFMNFPLSRHIGIGINPESNMSITLPFPSSDLRNNPVFSYSHERYFCWDFKFGFYLRFTSFNMKQKHFGGLFLDLGANYHLPIFFRHVGIYENHKDITRFLHKYNDISISTRIGTDAVSIGADYHPLEYIKSPFPQNPILNFTLYIRVID